ncbi:KTSC domain-containing protein [Rathayibacter sp. VKM Ac-2801]|nr:KTSC domain-containing protein [Rathayibacter sp. VKM Ac-2801]
MNRNRVVSSNVAEVGYDPTTKILEVAFVNGGVYQYLDIPGPLYDELITAPSIGRYLHARIKNAGYTVLRLA